jgi:Leucine-rich repeat (LRR) protein
MMETAKKSARGSGCHSTFVDPLVILSQLSSIEESQDLCHKAARALHRASKQLQSGARATLRHLPLDSYYQGLKSAGTQPDDLVPRQLLAACPNVTSWALHPEQLVQFHVDVGEGVAAAAARLKRLEVKGLDPTSDPQLQGLGRLLWACGQLEEVHITCKAFGDSPTGPASKPWLLLDPDSTSFSTAKAPPLPLRSWASHSVPYTLLGNWMEKQPQLCSSLTYLSLECAGNAGSTDSLAGLKGLKELTLEGTWPDPPKIPSSISRLTKLRLLGPPADEGALEAVCAHTTLQHLSLSGAAVEALPDTLASLKQLTCLVLTGSTISELPEKLGAWLPRLERLEAGKCKLAAVPASLTSLTHLDLSSSTAARLSLPATLESLQQLVISQGAFKCMPEISGLTALELLDMSFCKALTSLSILQPLTRLRHLNLKGVTQCQAASYTVLGALQQLTHLNLAAGPSYACCAALAGTQPLLALQQLDLSGQGVSCVATLGPWLRHLSALTWLSLAGCGAGYQQPLLFLPGQLQEVDLSGMCLVQLPSRLSQLQGLQVLHCSRNPGLKRLPAWLPQPQQLEVLDLHGTAVATEQEVLAHMPALRCVRVTPCNRCAVYGKASHLHFGDSSRPAQ